MIDLCLSPLQFKTKQEAQSKASLLRSSLHKYKTSISIENLAIAIGKNGQTFYSCVMGGTVASSFVSCQLIALDFDNDVPKSDGEYYTMKEVVDYFISYNIFPNIVYESLSSTPYKQKFRLIWVLPEETDDIRIVNLYTNALNIIAKDGGYMCDQKCLDIGRMWFGGKSIYVTYFDKVIDMDMILYALSKPRLGYKNYKRDMVRICNKLGVEPTEEGNPNIINSVLGCPPIFGRETWKLYNKLYIELPSNSSKKKGTCLQENKHKMENIRLRSDENLGSCRLLHEFMSGSLILGDGMNNIIFGLATNLACLCGGEKIWDENYYKNKFKNQKSRHKYLSYARKVKYSPLTCEHMECEYFKECGSHNIISKIKGTNRLNVEKVSDIETITLEDAREQTRNIIEPLLNEHESRDKQWNLVRIQTGVGKTDILVKRDSLDGICYCLPNHELAKEFISRRGKDDFLYIEELNRDNMPKDVINKIDELNFLGEGSYKYLKEVVRNSSKMHLEKQLKESEQNYKIYMSNGASYKDKKQMQKNIDRLKKHIENYKEEDYIKNIKQYLLNIDSMHDAQAIVMTHKRMSYLKDIRSKYIHTIVFDEDPYHDLRSTEELSYDKLHNCLVKTMLYAEEEEGYADVIQPLEWSIEFLRNLDDGQVVLSSLCFLDKQVVKRIKQCVLDFMGISINVSKFYEMRALVKNFDTITGVIDYFETIPNLNIVILSATVEKFMYEKILNKLNKKVDLNFYEVQQAEHKGKLELVTGRTYSRTYIKEHPNYIDDICKIENIDNIISYKNNVTEYTVDNGMWFGNCSGFDSWKGQDILVIGQPNKPSFFYELHGLLMSRISAKDSGIWKVRKIERNGYIFPLNSYIIDETNDIYTLLQIHFLEEELIQAVGRGRLISYDCRVVCYNNFPLQQAIIKN